MKNLRVLLRFALGSDRPSRFVSLAVFGTERRKSTVQNYRDRAAERGLTWEAIRDKPNSELVALFKPRGNPGKPHAQPDFGAVEEALSFPGMTLWTYWQEQKAVHPTCTLSYSRFAAVWREHAQRRKRSMRQTLAPGEKMFVDYSGKKPWYFNDAGQQVFVEMFVAALGRSGKVFAWCSHSQSIPDWVGANVRALTFYGGAPQIIVCDNLKAAVVRPGKDPTVQRTYLELGEHYGTAILPARPYRPRDKPKAEGGVLLMQRAFLPMLRFHRCGSLEELNGLLLKRVEQVNQKGFTKRLGSRERMFEREDAPALLPLPAAPFEFVRWSAPKTVPHDYHVEVEHHWYSVPEKWVGHTVEACIKDGEVVLHRQDHEPVRHPLSTERDGQTTNSDHMTAAHRSQLQRTPEQLLVWAESVGPNTEAFVRKQLDGKVRLQGLPKAEQARSLAQSYGDAAVEEAAGRALAMHIATPSGLKRLLSSLPKNVERGRAVGSGPAQSGLPVQPPLSRHPSRRPWRKAAVSTAARTQVPPLPVLPLLPKRRSISQGGR